jgi:hypothetical protein
MHNEIDVDASARKRFEREFGLGIIADPPHDANAGSKTRQRDGHITGHAARRSLKQGAVHLAVSRRQSIDLNEDVHVDIADTKEKGRSGV